MYSNADRSRFKQCLLAASTFSLMLASGAYAGPAKPSSLETLPALAETLKAMELPPLHIAFAENIAALGDVSKLRQERDALRALEQNIKDIDKSTLNVCDTVLLAKLQNSVDLGLKRAALGLKYKADQIADLPENGLSDFPDGKEWYRYFLHAWLGDSPDPDELFKFGLSELAAANARYDEIQERMGFEGDEEALREHLNADSYFSTDQALIEARYAERQTRTFENIHRLFLSDYGVAPAQIKQSPLGMSFPAPGYYNPDENTFYYNVLNETYDLRQVDWLFIHEATPGHHFFVNASGSANTCASSAALPVVYAYVEGWAAYTETLGKDLGLYQSPAEELSAIEWNMVRSARVSLDVALNYYDWSDERALAFWDKHVRGSDDIAQREIDRMRRWPVQVITYKYGANVFGEQKRQMRDALQSHFDVRKYHDLVLRYGDMPLAVFENMVQTEILSAGTKTSEIEK